MLFKNNQTERYNNLKDLSGTIGIILITSAIFYAIYITNLGEPLWAIFLTTLFANHFPWTRNTKTFFFKDLGRIIGITGSACAMIYAIYLTKSAMPLWAIIPIAIFANNFPWSFQKPKKGGGNKGVFTKRAGINLLFL